MSHKYKILELPVEGYWKCNVCLEKVYPSLNKPDKFEPKSNYWSSVTGNVYCGAEHSLQDYKRKS